MSNHRPIMASIDVTLIEKERLETVRRKSGKEAKFLKIVLFPVESEYGDDYMIKQSKERDEDVDMPILGNGRFIGTGGSRRRDEPAPGRSSRQKDDDLAF